MAAESWIAPLDRGIAGTYIIYHDNRNKVYVGSAVDLRRRRSEHYRELQRNDHDNRHLQRAWNKYGRDSFTFSVVETCEACDVVAREQVLLDAEIKRVGWRNLYNQSRVAGSRLGVRHTASTKQKMSKNNTRHFAGKSHSPETRELIARLARERWKNPEYRKKYIGKKRTPEQCQNISVAKRGTPISEEHKAKISAFFKGRPIHPNTLASLTKSPRMKGKRHSEETKAKLSAIHRGRVFSEEERRKISEGVRRWWAKKAATIEDQHGKEAASCHH